MGKWIVAMVTSE
jgi:Ca2+-binding EF-hand superfamily protein